MQIKTLTYSDAENTFEGVIVWDDTLEGKRPLVLVSHAYGGQAEFDVNKAKELAKLGYVGFAIDMYGKGKRGSNPEESRALMDEVTADRTMLLGRIRLAIETGKKHEAVDTNKVAAIGFCFGGKCVLDLARSGDEIKGVVSFHGVYDKPNIEYSEPIKASILVLHGWEDPLALPQQALDLVQELTERGADWNMHAYGHTGHSFTNPHAKAPENGMFFSEKSNRRSWKSMANFLEEVFE